MFSLFYGVWNYVFGKTEFHVFILGVHKAGKTLLVEAHGSTRILILNRPKQLDALSSRMIKGPLWYFTAFDKDDGARLLIMKFMSRHSGATPLPSACLF
ncbi:hypothetical protein ZEAMMB73_Zm00001d043114 [Zea mays]|uniref:Uncharacterized protein n=1 Tax=Zea mays TaxID=4577 RepID=A0A1D6N920_MAIZE|nr:hypothetical protein ZEAMMB73_Zm00001d043114 [Zea mays]